MRTKKFIGNISSRLFKLEHGLISDAIQWTRENAASLMKHIIIEQLRLDEAGYWEDATFVEGTSSKDTTENAVQVYL